jgi:hypothetical protein
MATIHPMGDNLYHIHFLDNRTDPGFGHGRPDLPGHDLPGGGLHPGNRPPGSHPVFPDNTLPGGPPPHVTPGNVVIMVRDQAGVWHYASLPAGQVPPPVQIDNTLPGGPPPVAGQPLPPTAAPKK